MKSRRAFMAGAAVVTILPLASARATPETMAAAIKQVTGDAAVRPGRVTLDIPPLVENGNTVPRPTTSRRSMSSTRRTRSRTCSMPR
jgi:sulfur-oxidizing protein SoxY